MVVWAVGHLAVDLVLVLELEPVLEPAFVPGVAQPPLPSVSRHTPHMRFPCGWHLLGSASELPGFALVLVADLVSEPPEAVLAQSGAPC